MINKSGAFLDTHDGEKIWVYTWENVENPKGVVQIFHGMAEHAGRYVRFAEYLNKRGFIVYADDHRGHGKSVDLIEELGNIGDNGFNEIVRDEYTISKLIKEKYPELPHIIFAHSFGSFIGQEYLIRFSDEIDGMILSGSSMKKGAQVAAGRRIADLEGRIRGKAVKSPLLDKLSFGSFNKKIKYPKSKFAWLSRDSEEVQKYEDDELCGSIFPPVFFKSLSMGLGRLYQKERLQLISKSIPILIVSGAEDPVGGYGKNIRGLFEQYQKLGIKNCKLKLYPKCRHELLNEINREDITEDIFNWIEQNILSMERSNKIVSEKKKD